MRRRLICTFAAAAACLLLFAAAYAVSTSARPNAAIGIPYFILTEETSLGPYSAKAAEDASVPSALSAAEACFSLYPQGFFNSLVCDDDLTLVFAGSIIPVSPAFPDAVSAFTIRENGRTLIVFDASEGLSQWTIMHELCHAVDIHLSMLAEEGLIDWSEEAWLKLCPDGFSYYNAYADERDRPLSIFGSAEFTAEAGGEPWFINRYSRTFPTEDRAVLFETLMRAGTGAAYLKSPHIALKLARYFSAIRNAFDPMGEWPETFWEEKLDRVLLAGGD